MDSAQLLVVLHAKLDAAAPATQSHEHHNGSGDRPSLTVGLFRVPTISFKLWGSR